MQQSPKLNTAETGDVAAVSHSGREQLVFEALSRGSDRVEARQLSAALRQAGLEWTDPRLSETAERVQKAEAQGEGLLDAVAFRRAVRPAALLIERALTGDLIIPDFVSFGSDVAAIFEESVANRGGAVADYIPQLGRVDPELFGAAVCTIDGQQLGLGDASDSFCVQSTSKPINYCLALEEHGEEVVHQHMGWEPSGQGFNELTLNSDGLPHNPMLNAGGIMSSALIRRELPIADRFDYVLDSWAKLSGGARPGFSNPTYLSERQTADRNFALGYFLREKKAFPPGTDLVEILEFYFQCCSLEMTVRSMAVAAATLANGGVCPLTGERVFRPQTVQKCLSMMYSCGMYDFSGGWAFRIGLPAKSGVSGVLLAVVPNTLGLCAWSPRLDEHGNSVRGIDFAQRLVNAFNFHNYDNLVGGIQGKKDPRRRQRAASRNLQVDLCWAAAEGDLAGIRRLLIQGADLDEGDYDGRTPLHLAASEGRTRVVEYLIGRGVELRPVDRWGNTPLDDARRGGHGEVAALLEAGAQIN